MQQGGYRSTKAAPIAAAAPANGPAVAMGAALTLKGGAILLEVVGVTLPVPWLIDGDDVVDDRLA